MTGTAHLTLDEVILAVVQDADQISTTLHTEGASIMPGGVQVFTVLANVVLTAVVVYPAPSLHSCGPPTMHLANFTQLQFCSGRRKILRVKLISRIY